MSKEITKAIILQEIQDKFKLRDFDPEKFLFDERVIPIYDIGSHVKGWKLSRIRQSVASDGLKNFGTVPADEKWKVRRVTVIHETGANFDIDQILHYNVAVETSVNYLFYDTTTPLTTGTVKILEFPQDLPLLPGDRIAINVSNYVAGGYVAMHMLKEVETIR